MKLRTPDTTDSCSLNVSHQEPHTTATTTASWPAAQLNKFLSAVTDDTRQVKTQSTATKSAKNEQQPTWRPPRIPLRKRILTAAATPTKLAIGVVCLSLLFACVYISLQTHSPIEEAAAGKQLLQHRDEPSSPGDEALTQGVRADSTQNPGRSPLFVHVVGAVQHPGVFELGEGARVADAITAAGGVTVDAQTGSVNLARKVSDGEQILVPDASSNLAAASSDFSSSAVAQGYDSSGLLNLNQASSEQLETLPRVGPTLAGRIIEWRTQNGPFRAIEEITQVQGIGEVLFAGLCDLITV